MDKEITKKFIENNGFICTQCGSVIVDGYNHENEEDLCEQCKIKKIKDLEKQLAEKEQEVERLNLEFETQEDWQEKWQKLYDATCNLNQNKTDFAIEQLEEVMQFCKKRRTPDGNNVLTINVDEELLLEDNLIVFIERKIKELKGESK